MLLNKAQARAIKTIKGYLAEERVDTADKFIVSMYKQATRLEKEYEVNFSGYKWMLQSLHSKYRTIKTGEVVATIY